MRFTEVWADWRGGRSARQIAMPGANVEVGGVVKTGAMALQSLTNRYLSWYCCANVLELTEMSLDDNITDNAVDVIVNHYIIPSSVTSCEADGVVIVTFATMLQLYWIKLSHPQTMDISILSAVSMDTIRAVSHGVTFTVDSMTSSIVTPERLSIVCNSKGGVVFMLLPHTGGDHVTTCEVLTSSSKGVVQRMWHGLMSTSYLPSSTIATDSVIDLVLLSSDDGLVAMAGCHDNSLRLFSHKQQKVISTYPLSEYIVGDNVVEVVAMVRTKQSTLQSMRFAVFLSSMDSNMVLIFSMSSSSPDLDLVYSTSLSPEYSLMRWQLSEREIWLILTDSDGDTVVKHAVYKRSSSSVLMDVTMVTVPEFMLSDHLSPRECYLDHIMMYYPSSVIRAVLMSMESSEMGSHDLSNMANVRSAMCHVVETEIQQQVIGSCGPQEYRQHQLTQWDQLLGYIKLFQDEQLRPPSGLFIDGNNGLVLLLGQQCAGVMVPCISAIDLVGMETVEEQDVNIVLQCVSMVTAMMTNGDYKMLSVEYCHHDDFGIIAASIADDIVARGDKFLSDFKERINDIQNVVVAMEILVNYLDPSCKDVDEAANVTVPLGDTLYASDVAVVTMVMALRQLVSRRISLCQQVIVLYHLYKLVCSQDINLLNHIKVVNLLSNLLKGYHGIHWLTVTAYRPSYHSVDMYVIDLLVRHRAIILVLSDASLGRLDISDKLPQQQSENCSLMELLLRSGQGNEIRRMVAKRLTTNNRMKSSWRNIIPLFINVTIGTLWNSSWSVVCDFLLSNHQYLSAKTYLGLLPWQYQGDPLYQFYLAQSLLSTAPDKSCDLFINAVAMGITCDGQLYRHCHGDAESCDPLLSYYRKVISLMEQMSTPVDHMIQIVTSALKEVDDGVLRSLQFKLYLQLDQYEAAYNAMVTITGSSRQTDCLRHFVAVLIEKHQWARLCSFPFVGLENEVEDIIEARARSMDISAAHSCYDLLYSYHVTRSNYRKGAAAMYEAAYRTGIEVGGDLSTDVAIQYCKQRNYYAVSLCALKLCRHDYQWLVRPASNKEEELQIVTYRDIADEYHVVCAKCELLWQHPDVSVELARAHVSTQELLTLLLRHGLFDVAFQLGRSLRLPLDTIYDNLAARCVSLTKSLATIQKLKLSGNNQSDYSWQWVGRNDPEATVNTKETTVVDNAWLLLRKHLMMPGDCKKYQSCVVKRVVAMGGTIPQWIIDHFKRTFPDGLLRIYVTNNMLEEALSLATECIDAALGHGAEYFGIDTTSNVRWLPHNTFGYLATAVEMSQNEELVEVNKQFLEKWNNYLKTVNGLQQ